MGLVGWIYDIMDLAKLQISETATRLSIYAVSANEIG